MKDKTNNCTLCGCSLHRSGEYAKPTVKGRSHATNHHVVAERFFGRSANRKGDKRKPIFETYPWNVKEDDRTVLFCYECHEELIHNPVFLPEDLKAFAELVKLRNLNEKYKTSGRSKIAGRIKLLHEVIQKGIKAIKTR